MPSLCFVDHCHRAVHCAVHCVVHLVSGESNFIHDICQSTGPTAFAASHCSNILTSFLLFIEPIEQEITKMTNLYGLNTLKDNWVNIEAVEMRAYFGLLLFAGLFRSSGESMKELWDDELGRPIFRATMTLERFKVIGRFLRFDDRAQRLQVDRRVRDKLAPIRNIYDKWNANLSRVYNPGKNVTVDEQLVPFRGRCSFKQYIPNKPAKYGIKIWACCDSVNAFTWNTQVYIGKAPNTTPEINQGKRVVLELTDGLKGRIVTADNFFTSHDLVVELSRRHLSFIGTVRKNKTFVPPKLLDMKKKPTNYSEFLFDNENKLSMVSYVPKKNKFVLLISSAHMDRNVSTNDNEKPVMILDYNKSKCGVDLADQMVGTYSCKRKTNRWPVALFSYMLDTSALNAYVVYTSIFPEWNENKSYKRRIYLKELAFELIKPQLLHRSSVPCGPNASRLLRSIQSTVAPPSPPLTPTPPETEPLAKKPKSRSRCGYCVYKSNSTKYANYCAKCRKAVCPAHSAPPSCKNCSNS